MADVAELQSTLTEVVQATRIVMRCLSNGRDHQDTSQKTVSLLVDILDFLYRLKDQISWAEEKWMVQETRLKSLRELLAWYGSTMKTIELYFQPGGVGVTYFRKHLLERSFLPRLEQYKIMFLLAMQSDSSERSSMDGEIRKSLKRHCDVDPVSPMLNAKVEQDALTLASRLSSEHFISLGDLCRRRQKGTCNWILENSQYRDWLLGNVRTLSCIGPPGTGKTFLSSCVVDSLQRTFTSPDVATVAIFCQDVRDKERSSIDVLRDILAQLVHCKRSLSHTTSSLYYSESLMQGGESPKAYLNAIRAEVNRFSKVYLIVDGIDMFSDKDRILGRLQKLPEQTQVLVTLREASYANNTSCLSALAPPEDIQLYTLSRILLDPSLRGHFDDDSDEFKLEVVRSVVERSHGLFLLANLHMDMLSRYTDKSLLERALFHLPESLSEAYGEAMKQVVSSDHSATQRVYWTLYSFRPLTVEELKCATWNPKISEESHSPTFEHSLQIQTAGLLTVDAVTSTVRFIHSTAREYLTGTAARVFFPNAQKDIAEVCLTVITPDEAVDDCYINDGLMRHNSSNALLDYAAMYWGQHARAVNEDEQTIQVLIKTFLNKLLWRRPPWKPSMKDRVFRTELGLGKYPSDWSALHILALFGILGKSRRLLEQGADIDARDNSMRVTPLHCAAHRGNDEMVEFLLDSGADGNAVAKDGNTALHLATQHGHRKVMKLLLARRVNSQMMNGQGATGLQLAVGTATDEATVPLLVKNKVGLNIRNLRTGNTALHLAVEWRRPRIILFLLEKGAGINLINEDGLTALQLAACVDNCEAIPLLLQRCAQVEARSLSGLTALQLAAHKGHWVAFDLLIIGGADINSWNNDGETLLHEQARNSSAASISSKLLQQGANIEARSSQGFTPLQSAAAAGNKAMVLFLIENGANVDVETAMGESLLHITPPNNKDCLDILRTLLDRGLDVQAVSSQGWTPLHQTVYKGTGASDPVLDKTDEYIQLLMSYGADVNAQAISATAETPLHLAAMSLIARPALVGILIDNGADIDTMTGEGRTALHLAAERGREAIFRVLVNAGAEMSLEIPRTPEARNPKNRYTIGPGTTASELARKNPLSVLWFSDDGKVRVPDDSNKRDSAATIIEDLSPQDSEGGTAESTLVGSEQPYIVV